MLTWDIGSVIITQIPEIEAGPLMQSMMPDATQNALRTMPWLQPYFADPVGGK